MPPRRREVRWSSSAADDLTAIVEFIAQDRPSTALEILSRIQERTESLSSAPEKGRRVPELERLGVREYRELVISVWRIVYKIGPKAVEVLLVVDKQYRLSHSHSPIGNVTSKHVENPGGGLTS